MAREKDQKKPKDFGFVVVQRRTWSVINSGSYALLPVISK